MSTKITKGTWVLIADGEKALILENTTDANDPNLVVRRKDEQDNPSDGEQSANRPGRMQEGRPGNSASGPRSSFDDTDWHQLAKDRFADDIAELLYKQAHKGAFERIILVAAPGVLGEIREKMHKEVSNKVVAEVPKTLTNHTIGDIEKILVSELA
ncbi:host attachment family protein [Profundibacterium mesophilum]|uniref:Protein required for attachment to host cells domain containing protein n=1 Tax=Profundibacterium mesophilum KAUST100406-0324 TaxID=1037889 RepID=A0A921TC64_9RHOB|nr:host attachment family protein [Profundibacterium mesophilum]KAF0676710.1 Protein required for attachment to host cells domain containing protein [Profundibacterium mesophilum KAUST100406-0324]